MDADDKENQEYLLNNKDDAIAQAKDRCFIANLFKSISGAIGCFGVPDLG